LPPSGRSATLLPLCHDWTRVVALPPFLFINTREERWAGGGNRGKEERKEQKTETKKKQMKNKGKVEKKNRGNRRTFSRLGKIEGDICLRTRGAENEGHLFEKKNPLSNLYLLGKYRETRNSCLLYVESRNESRHLIFWSLGTLTSLKDQVRGLIV
jgi:hypothetical protein